MESPPLEGAWAKLHRSAEHGRQLLEEADAYFAAEPYELEGAFDDTTSEWVVRVRIRTQPPLRWSTIIGDALHNLRSALDHFIYDLARHDSRKRRPRGTQFPIIARNAADYRQAGRPAVKLLDPGHRRVIRLLQPYQREVEREIQPLAILNRLSNADKHRLLHPTIGFLSGVGYRFEMQQDIRSIGKYTVSFGALDDGAEILRIKIGTDGPNPRMNVGGEFDFDLAFRETGESVIGTLFEIGFDVSSILNWFTPVFGPVKRT